MKTVLFATLLGAGVAFGAMAQTAKTSPSSSPTAPADANAPLPGANSFTEGQARSRLEANGYSGITGLKKDDQGVWRGTATYDGKSTAVSVDYRGNIARN